MLDPVRFVLFLTAALALLLTPGPAVLYIGARAVDQGRRAGLVSVAGIALGTMVHVSAAAAGLSALLLSSAEAFNAVKYAGAVYLIVMGLRKILSRNDQQAVKIRVEATLRRVFWEGVVVNVLNPKTALFFFAFLPQFVAVERGAVTAQMLVLGLTFAIMAVITDSVWALGAGSVGSILKEHPTYLRAERYVTGGVYVSLGLAAAFSNPRR